MKNLYLKAKDEIISWYDRIIFRIMQTLKFLVYNWEYKTFAEKTFWAERIGRKNRYAIFWPVEIVQRTWEKTKIEFTRKKNIYGSFPNYHLATIMGIQVDTQNAEEIVVSITIQGPGELIQIYDEFQNNLEKIFLRKVKISIIEFKGDDNNRSYSLY